MNALPVAGRWWMLAFFIAVCFVAAGVGSRLSGAVPSLWYAGLRKPAGTPPGWVFGPVWTVLYVCMAIAAWLVWKRAGWQVGALALGLWGAQLTVNVVWSWLFFGMHRPEWALIDVAVLWVLIVLTLIAFQPISAAAAWLLVPYLLWVAYAARLNYLLWQLNR